jgi:branched-chain amino acid transport system permease protein
MTIVLNGGLPLVATYGLLALGFVVIYRATGVLNFAHGGMMVLGGFLGFALAKAGVPGLGVFPLVTVFGVAIGWIFYRVVMRRLSGQPVWVPVLVTVGFGFFVIIGIIQLVWGPRSRAFEGNLGFDNGVVDLPGGLSFTTMQLVLMVSFVVVWLALLGFYRYVPIGIRMRAASQDHQLASYRAIDIDLVFGLAWGIATGLAMYVGFANAVNFRLDILAGVLALKAFPAALAGGLDSVEGVMFGALLIGLGEAAVQIYVDTALAEVVPFFVLFLVLVVRPWGIFGTPQLVDRV